MNMSTLNELGKYLEYFSICGGLVLGFLIIDPFALSDMDAKVSKISAPEVPPLVQEHYDSRGNGNSKNETFFGNTYITERKYFDI